MNVPPAGNGDADELARHLRTGTPVVVVESHEEAKVLALAERLARHANRAFYTWSVADGLVQRNFTYAETARGYEPAGGYVDGHAPADRAPATRPRTVADTEPLADALRQVEREPGNAVFALLDPDPFLADPVVQRRLKEIAMAHADGQRTLLLVGQSLPIAPSLARYVARFAPRRPDPAALRRLIEIEGQLAAKERGQPVKSAPDTVDHLVAHLAGLAEDDARRLIRAAIRDDHTLDSRDLPRLLSSKRDALGALPVEVELPGAGLEQVGGMVNLKAWLARRRAAFVAPASPGADVPKGVLLTGVQGAGKSLAARAVAGAWRVPLVRLEFTALYDKWQGETERRLREALGAAEAMAPCVLWIDEIEKALAAGDERADGGVSRRLLGTFLTWMNERSSRVFLVATSNELASMPPELLRKGRFDEIFFVDLPDESSRREIFAVHLGRRRLAPAEFDLDALARASDGYSGAEIEQAVVGAGFDAQHDNAAMDTARVLSELRRTRPLSVVMAEAVAALRAWADGRTVRA